MAQSRVGAKCTTPKPIVAGKSNRILFPSDKDYLSKITQQKTGRNTSGLQTNQRGFMS